MRSSYGKKFFSNLILQMARRNQSLTTNECRVFEAEDFINWEGKGWILGLKWDNIFHYLIF